MDESIKTYPITGIPLVPGQTLPTRQEITAWFNNDANKYQVSLFMQALKEFKETPIEKRLSYFQIAGIHCYPLVGWDGETGIKEKEKETDLYPGYCAHNRVTFPTWHRPYMLLYEQVLYNIMQQMIQKWKDTGRLTDPREQEAWRYAASRFRLPYWDWARKQEYAGTFAIPQVCTMDTLNIIMPGGKKEVFTNPLVKFENPTVKDGKHIAMGDERMRLNRIAHDDPRDKDHPNLHILPWDKCVATSRYGILADVLDSQWVNGINNWKACNAAMQDPQYYGKGSGSFADAVSRLFAPDYMNSWETFASTIHNSPMAPTPKKLQPNPPSISPTDFMSLEYVHNIVHNATGGLYMGEVDKPKDAKGYEGLGLGHMSDVPVAAFDPIFWHHHANIDRILAMWQTLHWDKWFDDPQQGDDDPLRSDPLLPFHHDTEKHLWSSDKARRWKELGYQYDDLVPRHGVIEGSPQYLNDLRKHINELYPSTSKLVQSTPGYTSPEETFHDYLINVVYDRYALKGRAYAILFFIGEPPEHLSHYRESQNFVGAVYTFSAPVRGEDGSVACDNCAQQSSQGVLSRAQIPITIPLIVGAAPVGGSQAEQTPTIPTQPTPGYALEPEAVAEVLRVGLDWRFVALGGTEIEKEKFKTFEVAVYHGRGTHPSTADELPTYGGYEKLRKATATKYQGSGNPDGPPSLMGTKS